MARSKIKHFKGFSIVNGDIQIKLSMSRFDKQFRQAQYQLDGNVMNSMVPFMPFENGDFIKVTRAASAAIQGSGEVYAAFGPQGRFLYEGKLMLGEESGSAYAKKGEKKIVTDTPLRYTKTHNPAATDHWFDAAKKKDGKEWIKRVKKTAGGGEHG